MKKLLLVTLLFAGTAVADNNLHRYNSLGEFVNTEMETQTDYMAAYDKMSASELDMNDEWYLNLIRLRVRATIGLEVPLFASFELKPMLELRWKRKLPKGFVKYKPTSR